MTDTSVIEPYSEMAECTVIEAECKDGLILRGLQVMPTKSWRGANPKSDPTKNMVVIYHGIAMPAHMLEEVVDTLVAYARIL